MFSILIAVSFFLLSVVCHVFLHRLLVRWRVNAIFSTAVYIAGFVMMGTIFFPTISTEKSNEVARSLWSTPLPLTSLILYTLLSCFHLVFYTSPLLGDKSPSSRIILYIRKKGSLSYNEIRRSLIDTPLITKRLDDLVAARWIERGKGRYRLLPIGLLLTRILETYRSVVGWKSSG